MTKRWLIRIQRRRRCARGERGAGPADHLFRRPELESQQISSQFAPVIRGAEPVGTAATPPTAAAVASSTPSVADSRSLARDGACGRATKR